MYNAFNDYRHTNRLRSIRRLLSKSAASALWCFSLFVAFFFNKATRLNVRKEEASFSATFLPFSSPFIVLISLYENGKTTTEVSRIQDSLDGHRGDEWIKLGIKLRWKFNFTRLVNMLILRAKILFYRPASGFCNCGKRKRLLWANKNARWIGWSSVFSTLPSRRAFS